MKSIRILSQKLISFDAFVMLNVSPQRATDPGNMNMVQDEEKFRKSLEVIRSLSFR